MSSLTESGRGRVLRGSVTTRLRAVPFTEDLAGDRPLLGLDPAVVQRAVEEGRQAGFDAGYHGGLAKAAAEAAEREVRRDAEVGRVVAALALAAAAFADRQVAQLSEVQDEVVDAALAIAEAILEREVSVATAPGRDAIVRALALAPEGDAVVHMHPSDIDSLGTIECGRDLTIVADATIEPGGCVLEVGACRVDTQLSAALARVRKALQ